jgi:hypothetical protein
VIAWEHWAQLAQHFVLARIWYNYWSEWVIKVSATIFSANGHIMLNIAVLVQALKLSSIESRQYLDG